MRNRSVGGFGAIVFAMLLLAGRAHAVVIITTTEVGGGVVFAGSGTLNLADLTLFPGSVGNDAGNFNAIAREILIDDPTVSTGTDVYTGSIVAPGPFGTSGFTVATSGTGDIIGVDTFLEGLSIYVPDGYAGGALSGTMTFASQTFASLGLTRGSYTWSWGAGANADSLALNIPEPSTLGLLGAGLLCLGFMRRKLA